MVALLLARLNRFGNAQLLKVLFQHAKRFVEMENLKVHIQKFVMMTMKLMVMDVRHLAKLKQTGNALDLKELQAHASLWYVEMREFKALTQKIVMMETLLLVMDVLLFAKLRLVGIVLKLSLLKVFVKRYQYVEMGG
jgi:hypothetical protein